MFFRLTILVLLFMANTTFRNNNHYRVVVSGHSKSMSKDIVNKMITAINNTKTLKYNLKITERIHGKMIHSESAVKLQKSPRKIYLYLKGPEVLWIEGQNNGNALVNPGTFPYVNLNLDPYGSIMRKDQHHTIHEVGFDYFGSIINNTIKKSGDHFEKYFIYNGDEMWNNRMCYKVTIYYPEFSFADYTVKKNETLITIARKLGVSEYMILENNPNIEHYDHVKEGDRIKVPNAYAKVTVLYIDKQYFLPVNSKIYDDKGLYESYEYYYLQVNPKLNDDEFTKHYKDYHF